MIDKDVSLQSYNTFGLNVSAKMLAHITDITALQNILSDQGLKNVRKFILGGGSNILFTKDVDALVLKNEIGGIDLISENENSYLIRSGAGVIWHDLVLYCILHNYGGIENLSLIPGNVGAAPMQNIGAYGVELKDVFHSLEAIDIETGEVRVFNSEDCAFGYRESVFKRELKDRYMITSVTLKLQKKAKLNTSYGAIEQELEKLSIDNPTIKDVSQVVINIRQRKLPDPDRIGNAGSFFKNPIIDSSKFQDLKRKYPNMVGYPVGNKIKLAAGWLIEECRWKGKVVGNTGSHSDQSLVLVNYGHATGVEIFDLSEEIAKSVYNTFGVQLQREVNVY